MHFILVPVPLTASIWKKRHSEGELYAFIVLTGKELRFLLGSCYGVLDLG